MASKALSIPIDFVPFLMATRAYLAIVESLHDAGCLSDLIIDLVRRGEHPDLLLSFVFGFRPQLLNTVLSGVTIDLVVNSIHIILASPP